MAAQTKQKILKAAQTLFMENGFAGTSMGKVAKLAGVNHSLIFHHFTNKQGLWLAAKEDIVRNGKEAPSLPSFTLPFKTFLEQFFTRNVNFYTNNKKFIKIVSWQRLEASNKDLPAVGTTAETQNLIDAIKHYQQQGDINKGHKPEFVLTLLMSIISTAALDPIVFIKNKEDKNSYLNFCIEHIITALSA